MSSKNLDYYRGLPYTRRTEMVVDDEDGVYWLAYIEELPGCKTEGNSLAEAMMNLDGLFDEFIQAKLEWDSPIPEPAREKQDYTEIVRTPDPVWQDTMMGERRRLENAPEGTGLRETPESSDASTEGRAQVVHA